MKKAIQIPDAPKPIGPYSQGILAGDTLYISGQIPINPYTQELVTGDIREQTVRVMENLSAILKAAGMDFMHVLKVSIFLSDLKNFEVVNGIYASYFSEVPPARETVQVAGLPRGAGIEISLVAQM